MAKRWTDRCRKCGVTLFRGACYMSTCSEYRKGDRLKFKAGSTVVVKRHAREGARTVVCVYPDIDGGRRLDKPVAGFVSWNVKDLRRA